MPFGRESKASWAPSRATRFASIFAPARSSEFRSLRRRPIPRVDIVYRISACRPDDGAGGPGRRAGSSSPPPATAPWPPPSSLSSLGPESRASWSGRAVSEAARLRGPGRRGVRDNPLRVAQSAEGAAAPDPGPAREERQPGPGGDFPLGGTDSVRRGITPGAGGQGSARSSRSHRRFAIRVRSSPCRNSKCDDPRIVSGALFAGPYCGVPV